MSGEESPVLGPHLALAASGHQRHRQVLRLLAGQEGGDAGVTDLLHGHGYGLGITALLLEFPHS